MLRGAVLVSQARLRSGKCITSTWWRSLRLLGRSTSWPAPHVGVMHLDRESGNDSGSSTK